MNEGLYRCECLVNALLVFKNYNVDHMLNLFGLLNSGLFGGWSACIRKKEKLNLKLNNDGISIDYETFLFYQINDEDI